MYVKIVVKYTRENLDVDELSDVAMLS